LLHGLLAIGRDERLDQAAGNAVGNALRRTLADTCELNITIPALPVVAATN